MAVVQRAVMSMEVGDRLRAARERSGLTIGDLAAKMGVHVGTVTLWENTKNRRQMGTKHIANAARALGIPVSELLGDAERSEPRVGIMTTDRVEEQLLRLFRLMPEKVQLLQLAQFVECANFGKSDNAGSHDQRRAAVSISGPVNSESP